MCFSATASFIMAGVTGATGIACLYAVQGRREVLLGAFPALFAVQQAVEGGVWLSLGSSSAGACALTTTFVLFAEVVWPMLVPYALLLVEESPRRKLFMRGLLAAGTVLAAYLLFKMWVSPYGASATTFHIRYENGLDYSYAIYPVYLMVTCGPFLLSTHRSLQQLGVVLVCGFLVAGYFYWYTFVSVWCFFAAGASILIYRHLVSQRTVSASQRESA